MDYGLGDIDQLIECLPSMHEVLGSNPNNMQNRSDNTHTYDTGELEM